LQSIKILKVPSQLPNMITFLGLFIWFLGIILSLNGFYIAASIFIIVCSILDGLDGRVARLMHSQSLLGKELDSLSDLVSFGVAPCILIYSWSLYQTVYFSIAAGFLFIACGAYRLARFNVEHEMRNESFFKGLPVPIAGGFIASVVILMHGELAFGWINVLYSNFVLAVLISIVALLMISNIPFESFKEINVKKLTTYRLIVVLTLALLVLSLWPFCFLFIFHTSYIVFGVIRFYFPRYFGRDKAGIVVFLEERRQLFRKKRTGDKKQFLPRRVIHVKRPTFKLLKAKDGKGKKT